LKDKGVRGKVPYSVQTMMFNNKNPVGGWKKGGFARDKPGGGGFRGMGGEDEIIQISI